MKLQEKVKTTESFSKRTSLSFFLHPAPRRCNSPVSLALAMILAGLFHVELIRRQYPSFAGLFFMLQQQ